MSRDAEFTRAAAAPGYGFGGEVKVGGNYVLLSRDGHHVCVSGQVPRVGDTVGVLQLPQNATVELDLLAPVD